MGSGTVESAFAWDSVLEHWHSHACERCDAADFCMPCGLREQVNPVRANGGHSLLSETGWNGEKRLPA